MSWVRDCSQRKAKNGVQGLCGFRCDHHEAFGDLGHRMSESQVGWQTQALVAGLTRRPLTDR
jgi:hypothetical protein